MAHLNDASEAIFYAFFIKNDFCLYCIITDICHKTLYENYSLTLFESSSYHVKGVTLMNTFTFVPFMSATEV